MRLSISEALRKAIHDEMERDPDVFCIGEDIGIPGGYGGAFTVTLGLEKDFRERIIDTPISEIGIFGAACGAAVMGMRPIADVQYGDFLLCTMDRRKAEDAGGYESASRRNGPGLTARSEP
jgi:pyruvate dehydrogenase E1 component beta subunit